MKINRYEYKCADCSYDYAEQRRESESQYFTSCPSCKGNLLLENEIFIEEEIVVIPEIIVEAVDEA